MPLEKIEEYITQFQELPVNLSNRITIDGGEPMLPYFMKNEDYIPGGLLVISKAGATPVIKTNGSWGNTYTDRRAILKSLAKNANFSGRPVTLNMPVDEFHENIPGVANIIADIVFSNYLSDAIYIELCGFSTIGSVVAIARMRSDLKSKDINTLDLINENLVAYNEDGGRIHIVTDYTSGIKPFGRAIKNHTDTADNLTTYVNKVHIDNDDNVTLNHVVRDRINNRPLAKVMEGLIKNTDARQR